MIDCSWVGPAASTTPPVLVKMHAQYPTPRRVSSKTFFTGSDESNAESLVVRADAGIDKLADLKGKTIGVWRGTSADFALRKDLETVGRSGSDLTIPDLDVTAIIPAFESPNSCTARGVSRLFQTWRSGSIQRL